jgi:multiple sugar transport system substrate-binding protein
MTSIRPARRVFVAAASLTALLAAAACGGGGGDSAPAASASGGADLTQQGDIEYWAGKDNTGDVKRMLDTFNAQHPNGKVTFRELPAAADQQRQQMIQNFQIKNPKMGVVSMDVVWVSEFAAKGIVTPLPAEQFPTEGVLQPVVDAGTYFGKLYGYPASTDGGMIYYRKDLLEKYDVEVPTTFDEIKAACEKIRAGENNSKLECYAGQYDKYEGLTVNAAEMINTAGGVIVGDDGKPNVATPEAAKGIQQITDMLKDGTIPKGAITWKEEEGRAAFQAGNLIFQRNWPYAFSLFSKTDGSSKVNGKFGVAPLPSFTAGQPGVSSLGGHYNAIPTTAENKGTAADFLKFIATEDEQRQQTINASTSPVLTALFEDTDLTTKYPYLPVLAKSVATAKARPKAAEYGDVTLAIQDAIYPAIQGTTPADQALQGLQTKLQTLIK